MKKKLDEIRFLSEQAEGNNKEAKELVDEAKDNHANATDNYEMLGKSWGVPLPLTFGFFIRKTQLKC